MHRVHDLGLAEKLFILVGVGPLRSAKIAEWMRANVPGVHMPDEIVNCLKGAAKPAAEGKKLCVEIIQQVREIRGVRGVHVMAYRQEELVAEIIDEAGLLPRIDERDLGRGELAPQDSTLSYLHEVGLG